MELTVELTAEVMAELVAEREIRRRVLDYCRGVDRLDLELMRSAYHPDAWDDHGTFQGLGWDLCARVVQSHRRYEATMHCVLNHVVELSGPSSASGEAYVVTYLFRRVDGSRVVDTFWGRYLDSYERRAGRWAIAHRVCVLEATASQAATGMPVDESAFRSGAEDRGTGALLGPAALPPRPPAG